jgi:hypothetical protein
MSRFVGNKAVPTITTSGGPITGELGVPTTNTLTTELVSIERFNACLTDSGGGPSSLCTLNVFNAACCQNNGGGGTNLFCAWTVPSSVQRVFVQMWGAGGGGGRGCGPAGRGIGHPGAAGAYAQFVTCVNAGEVYCMQVGLGGTGVTYGGMGCGGGITCICGPGIAVQTAGGGGGPACSCAGCCAPGGGISIGCTGRMAPGTFICCTGTTAFANGPWCACSACCRSGGWQRGADAFLGGWGARGTCRGRRLCSDSGGCFSCSFGGGGAGGTGHGSGQGLYSTPCCRGGRGSAGRIIIWM